MSAERAEQQNLLIDYARGELPPAEAAAVEARLSGDDGFRKSYEDIKRTFDAVGLLPDEQAPKDLVAKTVARIRQARQTEALIAREEAKRRAVHPTFSLRELGVAAAAVLLIAVALIPPLRQARHTAIATQCASNVGRIGSGMLAYANAYDDYLPAADGKTRRWLPTDADSQAFSNSAVLYRLIRGGYVSNTAFRCPAGGSDTFQATADMTDFPAAKYISYSYQHTLGSRGLRVSDPQLQTVMARMAILADSTPLFEDGKFIRRNVTGKSSPNHGGRGQNVLFIDRHVEWTKTPDVGVDDDNIFMVSGIEDYTGSEEPADMTDTFLLPTFTSLRTASRTR